MSRGGEECRVQISEEYGSRACHQSTRLDLKPAGENPDEGA